MTEVTADFAIEYLLDDCDDCAENKDGECMTQSHCFEVKQMAIKALRLMKKVESEDKELKPRYPMVGCDYFEPLDVFDKIMAEIIKLQTYKCFEDTEKLVALDEVLQIIDKYRGEV